MKYIFLNLIYISIISAQVQYGGTPRFFDTESERIYSIEVNKENQVFILSPTKELL